MACCPLCGSEEYLSTEADFLLDYANHRGHLRTILIYLIKNQSRLVKYHEIIKLLYGCIDRERYDLDRSAKVKVTSLRKSLEGSGWFITYQPYHGAGIQLKRDPGTEKPNESIQPSMLSGVRKEAV